VVEPVDLRILQANERTLLAWVRTGLALMAFGFVVARLVVELRGNGRDDGTSLGIGAAVVGVGVACQVLGAVRFVRARRELLAGRALVPGAGGPVAVAILVGLVGAGLLLEIVLR
jgi:putative membrane protein